MIFDLKLEPYQIKDSTQFFCKVDGQNDFPVLTIDKDSYIVNAMVETGLNFRVQDGVYNLQIGKYSSLAEDIFIYDRYQS